MTKVSLILFDDRQARQWEPFALTRPAGELLFGAIKLVERVERTLGLDCIGYLTSEHLCDFAEPGAPPVLREDALPGDRDVVYWCSRAAAELGQKLPTPDGAATYTIDGQPVGCFTPAGQTPDPGFLDELVLKRAAGIEMPVSGRLLHWVWELVLQTPEWLKRDLAAMHNAGATPDLPEGVYTVGDHPMIIDQGTALEPGSFFDLRDGPVYLGQAVAVRSGTRLAGPAAIGPHSRLLGGSFEKISTGPYSYIHGELANSVMLGHANKAHGGYIGHTYIGKWVNLGALTTNSDLKNNYHPVRVWTPSGVQNTNELKVGCFVGDHAKTGIGLMLSTGTVVGAGANVYGSSMPPNYVKPFSWGEGEELREHRLQDFLDTAAVAMSRRGVGLDERGRRYLESCWRRGRKE